MIAPGVTVSPRYWLSGDEQSLLEIKVDDHTGCIYTILLTALRPESFQFVERISRQGHDETGIPIVRPTLGWNGTHCRETLDIKVKADGASILVQIGVALPASWVVSGNVAFGIANDGSICGCHVSNIGPDAMRRFLGCLRIEP